jgi:hypothetical protein
MSYFIPRPRILIFDEPDILNKVVWPAEVIIEAILSPEEVFGPSEQIYPRTVIVPETPIQPFFDVYTGEAGVSSNIFLPALTYDRVLDGKVRVTFNGNVLTARSRIGSIQDLLRLLVFLEHHLSAYLSLFMTVFVRVDRMAGQVHPNFSFQWIIEKTTIPVRTMSEEERISYAKAAINLCETRAASVERFIIACIYYQQALRFQSLHESPIPTLNVAERVLNLAKCVETLLGSDREKVRAICRSIGYTENQIESWIIPLLLIRSKFDVAHAVGTRMPSKDIKTVRDYADRSIHNIRNLLIRVAQHLDSGEDILKPVGGNSDKERVELCESLRTHMKQPNLP